MAENDDLYKVEQAVRDYESDPDRITGRVKTGKRMYWFAWVIEILAAITGLVIAWTISWRNYITTLETSDDPETLIYLNSIRAALPFIIIAVVEITKIPLAQGFYYAKSLGWKSLFFAAILGLIFVTTETILNGLEQQFYMSENINYY